MSEILTITPHQPANQGSAATKALMKPSIANRRCPSPSGIAAQSSPTGIAAEASPRRSATRPISALAASAGLWRSEATRASRFRPPPPQAAFLSATKPSSGAWHGGYFVRSARILKCGRPSKSSSAQRLPMHLAEERRVLRLHMREEGWALPWHGRKRRRDGSRSRRSRRRAGNRARPRAATPTIIPAPPHGCGRCRRHVRRDAHHGQSDNRDRVVIDRVTMSRAGHG